MKGEAGRRKKLVQGKIGSLFGKKTDGYFHKRVEPGKEQFFLLERQNKNTSIKMRNRTATNILERLSTF